MEKYSFQNFLNEKLAK